MTRKRPRRFPPEVHHDLPGDADDLTELLPMMPARDGDTGPLPAVAAPPVRRAIAPPAPVRHVTGDGWAMKVTTASTTVLCGCNRPACQTRLMIDLRVRAAKALGQLGQLDEAERAWLRGDSVPGSPADQFRRESAALLAPRQPWAPTGGWEAAP